ncbi:hypothetical protein [uncultured Oscillibacter sp.]|uniref:hypothetical protein n=1 Tax=uncultured Oscillibacter sp. TaxID=876091 RepID=UPI00272C3740|nr:hypothetical protein [uncultured Oscillibacter sp.]
MKLDRTFVREVKKAANGDGSRKARFAFLNPARDAARKLSTPNVRDEFSDILLEYGRAVVGLCVAVTVWERRDRLESRTVRWATEVLKLWTNRPIDTLCLYIHDNLHPSRIEEYAGSFIGLTTEEA